MAIGKNIKFHREKQGLTLEQLSVITNVDVGTISALENRDSSRSKFFSALASGLKMTVAELELEPAELERLKKENPAAFKKDDGAISIAGLSIPSIEQQLLNMYRGMTQAHKEAIEQLMNCLYSIDNPKDRVAAGRDPARKTRQKNLP